MPRRNLIWIAAIILAAAVIAVFTRSEPPQSGPVANELAPIAKTLGIIRDNYYREPNSAELFQGMAKGMVDTLDPFSSYISPRDVEDFNRRIVLGRRTGIGLRVEIIDGQVSVIGPLAGSPAHRAGIVAGDRISKIGNRDTAGMDLPRVEKLLRCEPGEPVFLTIVRGGAPREFGLTGAEFPLESVEGLCRDAAGNWTHLADANSAIAYIRLTEFVPDTPERLQQAIRGLPSPRGLVLDLRDNPGGLLKSAVDAADLFLREGIIVRVVSRRPGTETIRARPEGTYDRNMPIVVLVNAGAASAAEIFAGALQANYRAVLVGSRTRGKGCVQSIYELPNSLGQINLTTAEYYLASDRPISRRPGSDVWGVDPDVKISVAPDTERRLDRLRQRAEVLNTPAPATAPATIATQPASAPAEVLRAEILKGDAQLAEAIRLLGNVQEIDEILRKSILRDQRARTQPADAADANDD